jgi:hypothetical protein
LARPPPPQVWPDGQFWPQLSVPPHPSVRVPQLLELQTRGVQPQWYGTPPPPQVLGKVQLPQEAMMPPQPFETLVPQV